MASVATHKRRGINSSAAIKVACIAGSTANLTLSGEQTVDGIALAEDDRVLVKDQTDGTENGIYEVATGTWERAPDFDGAFDIAEGTIVPVSRGAVNANTNWKVTNTGNIVIGTTVITMASAAALVSPSSGVWSLISSSNIAAGANIDVEWDETLYHEVKLIIEDAEADTDNVVVYSRLGYDGKDAGTIRSSSGDYDSVWTNLTGSGFSSPAATTEVQVIPPNLGSDVGEYFNATISVRNFASVNSGAYIEYDVLYHTTAGAIVPQKTFAAVIGFEESYNWIRLYLSTGSWAANGTIKLYGLANS